MNKITTTTTTSRLNSCLSGKLFTGYRILGKDGQGRNAVQDNEQIGRHEVKTADERVREDERG